MIYRRKPIEVRAVQWTGHNTDEVSAFADGNAKVVRCGLLQVVTRDSAELIYPGDYVVRDARGDIHTYERSLFEDNYEPLADAKQEHEQ